jgi:hypothetical protein
MPDDNPKHPPEIARIIRLEFERLACKLDNDHGDPSNFMPADMVAFFARC